VCLLLWTAKPAVGPVGQDDRMDIREVRRVRVGALAHYLTRECARPVDDDSTLGPLPALRTARERRGSARLAGLPTADADICRAALVACGSDDERSTLLRVIGAGHPVAVITAFAAAIHGLDPERIRERTVLLDPARPGRVTVAGIDLAQTDATTCGTTSALVALALADPVLVHVWTAGDPAGFADRWRQLQVRLHRRSNPVWPRWLGTSPWGVCAALGDPPGRIGARYRVCWIDDADPAQRARALAGLRDGFPIPVLVGNRYPSHYLLVAGPVTGDDADSPLAVYNPSGGGLAAVSQAEFAAGDLSRVTGFPHVHAMLVPIEAGRTNAAETTVESEREGGARL
jgi:hypothetical protein